MSNKNQVKTITSSKHEIIKLAQALQGGIKRKKHKMILIDTEREISRYLNHYNNIQIKYIIISSQKYLDKKLSSKANNETKIAIVPKALFKKLNYTNKEEGRILICNEIKANNLNQEKIKEKGIYLLLDNIEKPGNIGAILRTTDAIGINGIILKNYNDLGNPNLLRASTGTIFNQNIYNENSNQKLLDIFKANKYKVITSTDKGNKTFTEIGKEDRILLIIGSEDLGVSDFWLNKADIKTKIPMKGVADSLNASIATAILLYELSR